jgi:HSP20 family protein
MTTDTNSLQTPQPGEVQAAECTPDRQTFSPRADIIETGDSVVVVADMPGVGEDDVDITLDKSTLTIRGRVNRAEPEGLGLTHREFVEGDYERSFALSDGVDRDGIEATVSNGIVRLTLPKSTAVAARKIQVRAG